MPLDVDIVSPAARVLEALQERSATLATAESCTGGLVASMITDVPGASEVFDRGIVAYTPAAKTSELGLGAALIREHGAVSAPVAKRMAKRVRERAGTTWGLATTGIAGPTGGTPETPVGTVFVGVAGPDTLDVHRARFEGDRWTVKQAAAQDALDRLAHALAEEA